MCIYIYIYAKLLLASPPYAHILSRGLTPEGLTPIGLTREQHHKRPHEGLPSSLVNTSQEKIGLTRG